VSQRRVSCIGFPRRLRLIRRSFHSAALTDKTKVVIINTPHNPSGKVFSREELTAIAEICTKHDVLVLADEVVGHKEQT
jgi:aspartate/methionine/tyrosine aminotransferase